MAQLLFMTSYLGDLTRRDSPCVRCSGRGRTDLANVTQSQKFWQPSIPFVLHEGRMRSEQKKGCLWSSGSYPEFYSNFFLPRRKSNSESESKSKGSEERCAFEHKSASVHPPVRNRLLFPSDGTETLVVCQKVAQVHFSFWKQAVLQRWKNFFAKYR